MSQRLIARSVELLNYKLNAHRGFTPAAMAPPKYDKPRKGNTSLSLSAGVEFGDRLLSPPSSYQCFVFHILAKGILQCLHSLISKRQCSDN
jgi:hypothetical protein